ncbi:MAG: type I-F CRISPR-associated helicase Cas3f [Selenomonadaceae bacterium]|nr:type I-F CRISPR-associated helicase Cas3f [Selenomonadaceae bacterium]
MMVIFTSKSEKKALLTVRRILDAFANRIGDDTWQTIITEDGLQAVYTALRRNATKNMSVSCRWIRSRNRSELLWIVGKKECFNSSGFVAVNTTRKNIRHEEWENQWQYMPVLKSLTAFAALLHDWGKASDLFQDKLLSASRESDAYRHEFISCKLIEAVVKLYGDKDNPLAWLQAIAENELEEDGLLHAMQENWHNGRQEVLAGDLPVSAQVVMWLVLSHHRLPLPGDGEADKYKECRQDSFASLFDMLSADWGYSNPERKDFAASSRQCFAFSQGLMWDNEAAWRKKLRKWAARLLDAISSCGDGSLLQRNLLVYSRMVLMLSDHYISSRDASVLGKKAGKSSQNVARKKIWANTDKKGNLKQVLAEHLVMVSDQALKILHQLPLFANKMAVADNVRALKRASLPAFRWQDKAACELGKAAGDDAGSKSFFVVNMASTGCGKTIANAKIMQALSKDDSLRYILALGLRSLTLQTGDEYRERIGLKENELAVLIGSKAVEALHNADRSAASDNCGESTEDLLAEQLVFLDDLALAEKEYMDVFFADSKCTNGNKNQAFLLKPVLVTTIDHIMGATEGIRGGRQILPLLRFMSSDLVIDEIDDFAPGDLLAISRLVHLAGMLGRNVVISSATVPPDLAAALFRSFQKGVACYNHFYGQAKNIMAGWCDEFGTRVSPVRNSDDSGYELLHQQFVGRRGDKLKLLPARRKSRIANSEPLREFYAAEATISLPEIYREYFALIQEEAVSLHDSNFIVDRKTGKKVSFGVVRMGNINPCVYLSRFLMQSAWQADYRPYIMAYHSRQILLMRHEQEKYLDRILKRKKENVLTAELTDEILRKHLDNSEENNILFIVVSTPVEEVGRDHDFDWAILEPSSFRSVVQMAGRVRRHRTAAECGGHNVAVLPYNLRALQNQCVDRQPEKLAYKNPGYEVSRRYGFLAHDMQTLAGAYIDNKKIDACPRILKPENLNVQYNMVHLEHQVMADINDWSVYGPQWMHGWTDEYWWLTGLPQKFHAFRQGEAQVKLYAIYRQGEVKFSEFDGREMVAREMVWNIEKAEAEDKYIKARCWLQRDYIGMLRKYAMVMQEKSDDNYKKIEDFMFEVSNKYGEIDISDNEAQGWLYSDQFGMIRKKEGERALWEY